MPMSLAGQSVFEFGAWAGALPLAAESPLNSIADDIQFQLTVSITRLVLVLICPGLVWLLGNSTVLTERKRNAAIIAGMVRCLFSLGADIALVHADVHHYKLDTMLYQGVPVDMHIVFGCVAGTGLCLLWEQSWTMLRTLLLAVAIGLTVMFNRWCAGPAHLLTPLSLDYQTYDLVVQCSLPVITVFFYRLVDENKALIFRSIIYAFGYFSVTYFLVPSIILSMSLGEVSFPTSQWQNVLVAVSVLSVPGAWAAGQFAISGRGTPLALDPTSRLIVTGPYAYVRNPMQISCVGVAVVWAVATNSPALWIYVGLLVVALLITRVYEEDDLHRRFGERYKKYCRSVWLWLPSLWAYEEE
ncbi:MAG: methyltransferase [Planctomycetota bacterium]